MNPHFFNEYYQELKTAFDSGSSSFRYNSDRAHNAVVMCFMFDHSKVINMYCGQMSVLRTSFFDKINEHNEFGCNQLGSDLQNHLKKSLEDFLSREGTKLNILFENYMDSYKEDLVCLEAMQNAETRRKLSMKVLPDDLVQRKMLDHFTVSDENIYRFEDDKEQHSAICCFNNKENTYILQQNFKKLYELEGNQIVSLGC